MHTAIFFDADRFSLSEEGTFRLKYPDHRNLATFPGICRFFSDFGSTTFLSSHQFRFKTQKLFKCAGKSVIRLTIFRF